MILNLRPDAFVQGGLIDDVDAEITDIQFVRYDYNGKADVVPALGMTLTDSEGKTHDQYYSAGDLALFQPTEDGKSLEPAEGSTGTALTNSCKCALFLASLVTAGFPPDKLESGDITILKGLKAHFTRQADQERKGLVRAEGQRDSTTLLVSKIIKLPWEAAGATKGGGLGSKAVAGKPAAGAPAAAAPASTASDTSHDEELQGIVIGLLAEKGSIAKGKISAEVFKAIPAANKARNPMMQRAFKDEFLNAGATSGLWVFDGATISLPA